MLGKEIIPPIYEEIVEFSRNKTWAKKGFKWEI